MLDKRDVKTLRVNEVIAVAVFSGGIPREVIRLVDLLANSPTGSAVDSVWPARTILIAEVAAFREEIEGEKNEEITDNDRLFVPRALGELVVSRDGLAKFDFYQLWDMSGTSEVFQRKYSKDFRRLLNRLVIGQLIGQHIEPSLSSDDIAALQEAVVANERDPSVGMLAIGPWISEKGLAPRGPRTL